LEVHIVTQSFAKHQILAIHGADTHVEGAQHIPGSAVLVKELLDIFLHAVLVMREADTRSNTPD
jgi:hypothetical protein